MNSAPQREAQEQPVAHAHPTARTFIKTGLVLFVITAVEFGIVYIEGMRPVIVTALFLLSILKFLLVVGYFMHLKFDNRLLRWVFAVGVLLATGITVAQKIVNQ